MTLVQPQSKSQPGNTRKACVALLLIDREIHTEEAPPTRLSPTDSPFTYPSACDRPPFLAQLSAPGYDPLLPWVGPGTRHLPLRHQGRLPFELGILPGLDSQKRVGAGLFWVEVPSLETHVCDECSLESQALFLEEWKSSYLAVSLPCGSEWDQRGCQYGI